MLPEKPGAGHVPSVKSHKRRRKILDRARRKAELILKSYAIEFKIPLRKSRKSNPLLTQCCGFATQSA